MLKALEFPRSDEELLHGLRRSPFALERIRCARELANRGDERVIAALLRALRTDRFWGVRAACGASLGEIGRRVPGIAERLGREADQESTRVRRGVLWGLGWIGDEVALAGRRQPAHVLPAAEILAGGQAGRAIRMGRD